MTTPRSWGQPRPAGAGRAALAADVVALLETDPGLVARLHAAADTDGSPLALHHTLGGGALQAAPGDHAHVAQDATNLQLVRFEEDFLAARAVGDNYAWLVTEASGTGAAHNASNAESGRPGIVALSTGTTAAGAAAVRTNSAAVSFNFGLLRTDWIIELPVLSSATDEYRLRAGFIDTGGGGSVADGAWLEYHRPTSVNWLAKTFTSASGTTVDTGIPVAGPSLWMHLAVEVNENASRVDFYVNGATAAAIGSNIPAGTFEETGCGLSIGKLVGTGSRSVLVDYARLEQRNSIIIR